MEKEGETDFHCASVSARDHIRYFMFLTHFILQHLAMVGELYKETGAGGRAQRKKATS